MEHLRLNDPDVFHAIVAEEERQVDLRLDELPQERLAKAGLVRGADELDLELVPGLEPLRPEDLAHGLRRPGRRAFRLRSRRPSRASR